MVDVYGEINLIIPTELYGFKVSSVSYVFKFVIESIIISKYETQIVLAGLSRENPKPRENVKRWYNLFGPLLGNHNFALKDSKTPQKMKKM